MKVYIAGSLAGLDADQALQSFRKREDLLRGLGYTVLSPLAGKDYLLGSGTLQAGGYENPISRDSAIFDRDRWMVHSSDILWADFTDAPRASIGSCFELAWAFKAGKKVIVSGVAEGGPMDHAFVRQAATISFESLYEAAAYFKEMASLILP